MTGPQLNDGEVLVHDHIPSLRAFRRMALLGLALSILPVLGFVLILPETIWPVVPMFLTALLLMQERFRLGRHRAWITSERIIFQGGRFLPLSGVTDVRARSWLVQVNGTQGSETLTYAKDPSGLAQIITDARAKA